MSLPIAMVIVVLVLAWRFFDNLGEIVNIAWAHIAKTGTDAGRARKRSELPRLIAATLLWGFCALVARAAFNAL